MSSPFKTDVLEVVSGGAADPRIVSGTADPTLGFSGPEGSIYLRYGAGIGKIYVKSGAGATAWGEAVLAGGGGGSLDVAYDFGGAGAGRTITADSGAVQVNGTTANTQAALVLNRSPSSAAAAVGLEVTLGANANASSNGVQINDSGSGTSLYVTKLAAGIAHYTSLQHVGAQALVVAVNAATTVSPVSIVANTTGTTADLLSISKIPGAATAGNAISVSMGANASGAGIYVSHAGTGAAIEIAAGGIQAANSSIGVSPANTGRLRYNSGTQTFQVSLNGAAYVDVATGAGFTLDIGDAIGSSTVGSVLFVGAGNALAQDNANLFWDDTNNRLGIGTTAPAFPLDVRSVLGNTAGRFGADWPMTLVQGTAFSLGPSIGFGAYYNGGWRFADGPLFNYAAYTEYHPSNNTWGWYRASTTGLGSGTLFSGSTLQMQIDGSDRLRVPNLGVFSPGGNYRGIITTSSNGTFLLEGYDLIFETNNKRLCLGPNPAFSTATLDINKPFALQISTRNTAALSATSGSTIYVSVEPTPNAANQRLGGLNFGSWWSFDIITPFYGAMVEAFSEAAWTASTSYPTYLAFKTTIASTTVPAERLRIPSDGGFQMPASTAAVSAASTGRIRYNSTGQKFEVSTNGTAYVDLATGAGMAIGNSITSATAGSVLFAGAAGILQQDNANFSWDNTAKRLGIGTTTPAADLEVEGASPNIFINGTTVPMLRFSTAAIAPPQFTTSSNGTRLILYPWVSGSTVDFAIGVDTGTVWSSVGAASPAYSFKWYAGITERMRLTGDGGLEIAASTAAVSSASTGRLRYNTTGEKFQVSVNGSSYVDLSPGVERLSVDGAADPAIQTTLVSGAGTDLTLANGVVDGFIKNFVITGGTGTITPANLADGNVLTWSATPANVSFIWDATGATWHVYGNPYNMVTT